LDGSGFAGGAWNGPGLRSTAAGTNGKALGYALVGSLFGPSGTTFDGVSAGANDVLVKYTYYGDATLDGKVDVNDFSLIDFFQGTKTGATWLMGDFTFDGAVDINDFSLIDFFQGDGTTGNANPQL